MHHILRARELKGRIGTELINRLSAAAIVMLIIACPVRAYLFERSAGNDNASDILACESLLAQPCKSFIRMPTASKVSRKKSRKTSQRV